MSHTLLFEKELEDIRDKIHQFKLKETEEDNSWSFWFNRNNRAFIRKTCLERKGVWQSLKIHIERHNKIYRKRANQK